MMSEELYHRVYNAIYTAERWYMPFNEDLEKLLDDFCAWYETDDIGVTDKFSDIGGMHLQPRGMGVAVAMLKREDIRRNIIKALNYYISFSYVIDEKIILGLEDFIAVLDRW